MEDRTFNSNSAKFLAELSEKSLKEKLMLDCSGLMNWLQNVYEDEIRKAINSDHSRNSVWIKVPKKYRVYGYKTYDIKQFLQKEFKNLGFEIDVEINYWCCPLYLFCGDKYKIKFRW